MPLDGSRADEQLCADLRVRQTVAGEARNVRFLFGQVVACLLAACTHCHSRGSQLLSGALLEPLHRHRAEHLVCGAQLAARIDSAVRSSKPLAVEQVRAGKLAADASVAEMRDGLAEQGLAVDSAEQSS